MKSGSLACEDGNRTLGQGTVGWQTVGWQTVGRQTAIGVDSRSANSHQLDSRLASSDQNMQ